MSCGERSEPGADQPAVALAASDTVFYQGLSWSPDGTTLLLSVLEMGRDMEDYTYRIYRLSADGSGLTRLTEGPRDYWTSWSPDGSQIAFTGLQADNFDIYVMDADGENRVRLTDHLAEDTHPDWSPDEAAKGNGYREPIRVVQFGVSTSLADQRGHLVKPSTDGVSVRRLAKRRLRIDVGTVVEEDRDGRLSTSPRATVSRREGPTARSGPPRRQGTDAASRRHRGRN